MAEVYREGGRSGKNTDRPEYQRMLKEIKNGKIDVLLCTKIDRVHRSLVDFYKLHELLEAHNVTFVSLSENWDTSAPMGRFGLKLTLAVAELEREQTSQRTKEKMRWRAEQGLRNGGQVFGYDLDPDEKGVPKINPEESKIVRHIFETYREIRSFRRTAQRINEMGYRTKSYQSRRGHIHGNKKFSKCAAIHILQNPIYIGKVAHNGELFDGKHEAIIDERLWQDVNATMKANRVIRAKPREQNMHTFLLEGLIRCGWCGSYMTPTYSGGRNGTYFYYQCTKVHNGADECKMKRVSAEALEEAIARRLIDMSKDEGLLRDTLDEANTATKKERKIIEERLELQKRALAPIEQEIANIVKFIAQGKGSPALAGELERLEIQKKEIEGEMERIELEARELKNRTINAEVVSEGLGFFERAWQAATPKQRKDLMRLHVHRIIWTPEQIKMGLYTRPTSEMYIKPTAVNHIGVFAVDCMNWLPECASARKGKSHAEPEVWFRIVHVTTEDNSDFSTHQEQTVEIALGPKVVFENGNVGSFKRQVPSNGVVNAIPPRLLKPRPQKIPKTPRVAELLRKAIEWQGLLESGDGTSRADIAKRESLSRARVTQIMYLLNLAPDIQQHILSMPEATKRYYITERRLRPISRLNGQEKQMDAFGVVLSRR